MSSPTDILNMALSHLGETADAVDIEAPTSPAEENGRIFFAQARDVALSSHNWGFNSHTASLPLLDAAVDGWEFVYALPNGFLRVFGLWPAGAVSHSNPDVALLDSHRIETLDDGTMVLATDTENAVLRYARTITDTSKFSASFTEALSWLLASKLAGPLIKGQSGERAARDAYAVYLGRLADARSRDANDSYSQIYHVPDWISAR